MKAQRIAVTGASGFIGGAIVRALLDDGHSVIPFGRRPAESLTTPLAGYRQWDLSSGPIDLAGVDLLVHCAASVGQWGPERDYHRGNVIGTRHALESIGGGTRVVYISSASVYAARSRAPISEAAATVRRGGTAYVRTKAEAERLVLALGERATVLRPHIVYGPGDTTLWPRVKAKLRRGVLKVPGNGESRVSTTHVENLIQALRLVIGSEKASGAYNVADAEPQSVGGLLSTVFARKGLAVRLKYVPKSLAWTAAGVVESAWRALGRADEPPLTRYAVHALADDCVLDISRVRRELGYTPRWSIADGPL